MSAVEQPAGTTADHDLGLDHIEPCFGGAVPAVMATVGPDGIPNVTYVSRAHRVDDERIALSNQFMSKTARNLAANPRACLLLVNPASHDEYRLSIVYERTERRGHVFERLRHDVDVLATVHGMEGVFRMRAADIFRVIDIARIPPNPDAVVAPDTVRPAPTLAQVAEITARIGRCNDLDALVDTTLAALDQVLGFEHSHLMLVDEEGRRLYTIGSHGFDGQSIGAEVAIGEGMIGTVAARCEPIRLGNLRQMSKYSQSVRRQFEDDGVRPGREVPMPGLDLAESRLAVPAMARGELVGVLTVDSYRHIAFSDADQQALMVIAATLASAIEHLRAVEEEDDPVVATPVATPGDDRPQATLRFFPVDGSCFLDNDYLVKGVAGRILWSLLRQHEADGRIDFTNRELRLDRSLEMPGFKDNLESRLILLKRRLDERAAPVRIERTGRGRFRLHTETTFRLVAEDA